MYGYENNFVTELYHHGILGQRWGVRRFQNEDGSLTSDGRKRYSKSSHKSMFKIVKQRKKEKARAEKKAAEDAVKKLKSEKKKYSPDYKKPVAEYSNEELVKVIERLRLEQAYYQYLKDVTPKTISKGERLTKALTTSATALSEISRGYNSLANIINTTQKLSKSFSSDPKRPTSAPEKEKNASTAKKMANAAKKVAKQIEKNESKTQKEPKIKKVKAELYNEPKKKRNTSRSNSYNQTYWSYTPYHGTANVVRTPSLDYNKTLALPYSMKRY